VLAEGSETGRCLVFRPSATFCSCSLRPTWCPRARRSCSRGFKSSHVLLAPAFRLSPCRLRGQSVCPMRPVMQNCAVSIAAADPLNAFKRRRQLVPLIVPVSAPRTSVAQLLADDTGFTFADSLRYTGCAPQSLALPTQISQRRFQFNRGFCRVAALHLLARRIVHSCSLQMWLHQYCPALPQVPTSVACGTTLLCLVLQPTCSTASHIHRSAHQHNAAAHLQRCRHHLAVGSILTF